MTLTTERPTDRPTGAAEPRRQRAKGRHRATAVVRADSVAGEMNHGEILHAMTGLLAALFTAMRACRR
jgi:hypothetical protein